jgi:hypothetical protein
MHTATPGARIARPLLLCSARTRRPRARFRRASNPRTHGLPPTRTHTNYIPKCVVPHRPISYTIFIQALVDVVPKRPRRPVQGYEDEE